MLFPIWGYLKLCVHFNVSKNNIACNIHHRVFDFLYRSSFPTRIRYTFVNKNDISYIHCTRRISRIIVTFSIIHSLWKYWTFWHWASSRPLSPHFSLSFPYLPLWVIGFMSWSTDWMFIHHFPFQGAECWYESRFLLLTSCLPWSFIEMFLSFESIFSWLKSEGKQNLFFQVPCAQDTCRTLADY